MRGKSDQSVLAWWAVLGLGLGLIVLSVLLWVSQDPEESRTAALERDLRRLAPVVSQLRAGQTPTPEMLQQVDSSTLAPLVQALMDASRQRQQALVAYQTQIESVALGEGLVPSTLVIAAGRHSVRQRLAQLRAALDQLIQQDRVIQARLDEAMARWLQESPGWGNEERRQALMGSSQAAAATMASFFEVERSIVGQVETLLGYLDKIGPGVAMDGSAQQQELVFSKAQDLDYYRAALLKLGDLGRLEQQLLADAQQSGGHYARRVGDLLVASTGHAAR